MSVLNEIKDNKLCFFKRYCDGVFFYETENGIEFEIPLSEVGFNTLLVEDKAIFFMKWLQIKFEESK